MKVAILQRSNPVGTSPSRIIGIRIPDFGTNNPQLVPLTIIHQQSFKVPRERGQIFILDVHFMDVTSLKPWSVVAETLKHGASCVQTSWAWSMTAFRILSTVPKTLGCWSFCIQLSNSEGIGIGKRQKVSSKMSGKWMSITTDLMLTQYAQSGPKPSPCALVFNEAGTGTSEWSAHLGVEGQRSTCQQQAFVQLRPVEQHRNSMTCSF